MKLSDIETIDMDKMPKYKANYLRHWIDRAKTPSYIEPKNGCLACRVELIKNRGALKSGCKKCPMPVWSEHGYGCTDVGSSYLKWRMAIQDKKSLKAISRRALDIVQDIIDSPDAGWITD